MIVVETILQRWYAFGFVAGFFWAASAERDWKRALRFFAIAASVSWIAEYASTHYGFPYGRYQYIANTQGEELYLSNIPAFVPLSFGVVVWAGRALAQAGLKARSPMAVVAGGALMATLIDVVVDPMTLRGGRWFLGALYEFESSGPWFDVPWSNFGGWLLVSAIIIWADEGFETKRERLGDPVRGPTLAAGICAFFIVIALATGHWAIALAEAVVTAGLYFALRSNVGAAIAAIDREPGPADATS